jgi:hypothetical protein
MLVGELAIPHEIVPIPLDETKTPKYLAINPNARVPAIYDPNTDLTLFLMGERIKVGLGVNPARNPAGVWRQELTLIP